MYALLTTFSPRFWLQGKSTLSNWLLQDERCLTGPEPGLTRDAVLARLEYGGRQVALVDTAGRMRRSRLDHFDDSGYGLSVLAFHSSSLNPDKFFWTGALDHHDSKSTKSHLGFVLFPNQLGHEVWGLDLAT